MSIEVYIKEYNSGKSIKEIAEQFGTYPNKIRRMFQKAGVKIRGKSEAQTIALESGRASHPTIGTIRDASTKRKISDKVGTAWDGVSPEELQKRKDVAKKLWDKKPEYLKKEMYSAAAKAVAKAGREGSKTEKIIMEGLQNAGFTVIWHKEGLIENNNLQLDLFIPELKLAIEIDGPTHFLPIWGEEKLQKKIASDREKNGLLLKGGYSIIRVKCIAKNVTQRKHNEILNFIIQEIKNKSNTKNYYSEIEVK